MKVVGGRQATGIGGDRSGSRKVGRGPLGTPGTVGIDTGLTHISVQQGTPTVGIYRNRPVYFRPWPHCRAVVGDRCDDACQSLERTYAYNTRVRSPGDGWQPRPCPVGARCLDKVRPADVLDALRELL